MKRRIGSSWLLKEKKNRKRGATLRLTGIYIYIRIYVYIEKLNS